MAIKQMMAELMTQIGENIDVTLSFGHVIYIFARVLNVKPWSWTVKRNWHCPRRLYTSVSHSVHYNKQNLLTQTSFRKYLALRKTMFTFVKSMDQVFGNYLINILAQSDLTWHFLSFSSVMLMVMIILMMVVMIILMMLMMFLTTPCVEEDDNSKWGEEVKKGWGEHHV